METLQLHADHIRSHVFGLKKKGTKRADVLFPAFGTERLCYVQTDKPSLLF